MPAAATRLRLLPTLLPFHVAIDIGRQHTLLSAARTFFLSMDHLVPVLVAMSHDSWQSDYTVVG